MVWIASSTIIVWISSRSRVERRGCGNEAKVEKPDSEAGFVVLMWWKEGIRWSRRRELIPFM